MNVLGEFDLLGSYAHGVARGEAVLKAVAEDFQVDEMLDIPPSGKGEHLWSQVEKRGLNTEEAARRLGCAVGVQQKNVSYAGLKDRQVLIRQWFSLHLLGKVDPDLGVAEGMNLRTLRCTRHSRRLQRGAHTANGFTLRLTGLRTEYTVLDVHLEHIAVDDMSNYFDLQRSGHGGGNLVDARSHAEQDLLPANRDLRSRFFSVGRSHLFNRLPAEWVVEGSWNWVTVGDLLAFTDGRSFFLAGEEEYRDARLAALDLRSTGSPWGEGNPPSNAGILDHGLVLARSELALCRWLAKTGMVHGRRILRLPIQGLAWHYLEPDVLQLEFVLPVDCSATIVMCETLDLVSTKQTENPCIYWLSTTTG